MSTERPVPCRGLDDYVRELVARLAASEPAAFRELRATVGGRRARIGLGRETVRVAFAGDALEVTGDAAGHRDGEGIDGEGATDGSCVADLLDGYTEVATTVLDGRLRVRGPLDGVLAMLGAIEIILDVSARSPGLQMLARDLRADPCRPVPPPRPPGGPGEATHWRAGTVTAEEARLLARLDLLPDAPPPEGNR